MTPKEVTAHRSKAAALLGCYGSNGGGEGMRLDKSQELGNESLTSLQLLPKAE